jgi:arylsulfatase A-like enzyme
MGFEVELNRIPPAAETMPEFMQSMGYRTYGYADNPNIDATMGFARGFDHFSPGMDRGAPDLAAEVLTKSAEIANGPRPSFLYLHFMDPHIPYERRDPYFELEGTRGTDDQQEQLANYDSEIGRVDAALAQLAEALHWDKDTVIVITSDHGEEFGDHGGSAHGPQLYNELLKVPMIVFGADENGLNLFEAKRVEQPVCGIDLLPTLRGLLGDDASDGDRGIDLTPLLTGTNPVAGAAPTTERILFPERPMEFVLEPFDVRAAIDRDLKLYDHSEQPTASLYNMQVDPKEVTDIAAESPEHVERLALQLQQHFDQAPLHERSFAPAIEIDSQAAKDLQRLGYAGDE